MSVHPDLYALVTERIVAALEAGTPPWIRPWSGGSACDPTPANATSQRPYRGINVLLLNLQAMSQGYGQNRWLTFQQALSIGACVRKGEHGTPIVFFKMHEVGDATVAANDDAARRVVPLLRCFTVFNVAQVDGLPEALAEPVAEPGSWEPLEEADSILALSGAEIRHAGSRAFYMPSEDLIQLPPHAAFASATDYYATALHELTHWTGHPSRCNRPLGKRHGISAYAFKELVAEMGAALLSNHCRLPGRLQHASYIASWLEALRNDKRLIFTAASQAQKAADYLLPKPTEVEAVATVAEAA